MTTRHTVHYSDSRLGLPLEDEGAALIVTSPPYPMIQMWDPVFSALDPGIETALASGRGAQAFELMHAELDRVWAECVRALQPGGIACINIGDAVRTMGGRFRLYSSHARIIQSFEALGLDPLPLIIWRKQTNAPNKFMGSGMLPPGAYVTLEHEYILVFRKGDKRGFEGDQKKLRRESAFFWEERNNWFSDVWLDLKGARQALGRGRDRSGAFPFELAYRLVNMFSVRGDTVLDPFLGTGVTVAAAVAAQRNSVGIEIDETLKPVIAETLRRAPGAANERIRGRLRAHAEFAAARTDAGKPPAKMNLPHQTPCVSAQETDLEIMFVDRLAETEPNVFEAAYADEEPLLLWP